MPLATVLAADLGGTKCRFALVSEDFQVVAVQRVDTSRDQAEFLRRLEAALAAVLASVPPGMAPPLALGVGTAGVVPPGGRAIHHAPNVPLTGFPLADHLERLLHLPTTVINDGRASAFGEYLRGHAKGRDPLLCLFFGTGIGIGLMIGGRPYGGANNAAGEIGHTFHRAGRTCPCGADGHFEAWCGGRAIVERAAAELGPPGGGGVWTVSALAAVDSPASRAILDDAAQAAAVLTANACTLLAPSAVVLGGGVLAGWPRLRATIEIYVRRHCSTSITEGLAFVPSLGDSDAILWGAAGATGALWRDRGATAH